MYITYIDHSGFLLELSRCSMLFDFAHGSLPRIPAGKPLYVFASHAHGDHYDKRIFREVPALADEAGASGLRYILSSDIPGRDVPSALRDKTVFLKPHTEWQDGCICVETLLSNDEGVAFVIAAHDGDKDLYGDESHAAAKQIYFAGDLNAWNWDGEEADYELLHAYREELSRISAMIFDVAFIPLDHRLGDAYTQGITDFFDVCGCEARTVVPIHCWGRYNMIKQARKKLADKAYADRIAVYGREGERFRNG